MPAIVMRDGKILMRDGKVVIANVQPGATPPEGCCCGGDDPCPPCRQPEQFVDLHAESHEKEKDTTTISFRPKGGFAIGVNPNRNAYIIDDLVIVSQTPPTITARTAQDGKRELVVSASLPCFVIAANTGSYYSPYGDRIVISANGNEQVVWDNSTAANLIGCPIIGEGVYGCDHPIASYPAGTWTVTLIPCGGGDAVFRIGCPRMWACQPGYGCYRMECPGEDDWGNPQDCYEGEYMTEEDCEENCVTGFVCDPNYFMCEPAETQAEVEYSDIQDCYGNCPAGYYCDSNAGACRPTKDPNEAEYSDYNDCMDACSWWKCEQGSCSNGYDAESGDYQTQAECEENCGGGYYCDTDYWSCEWTDDAEQAEYQTSEECYESCHPGYVCDNLYCRETYGDEQAEYSSWEDCYYNGCYESYICEDGQCRQAQQGEGPGYMYYEECQYYCETYICDNGECRPAQSGETGEYSEYEECQYYCENGGNDEE